MDCNSYSYTSTRNSREIIACTDSEYPNLGVTLTKETNWFNETSYWVEDYGRDIAVGYSPYDYDRAVDHYNEIVEPKYRI